MNSTLSKAGRGLCVKKGQKKFKGEQFTFFGFPLDIDDSYGSTNGLPKITDYMYRQNRFVYDNKRDADIFKLTSNGCYLPNQDIVRTETYPLCQDILDTGYRGLRVMNYQILVATRDILGVS